MGGRVISVLAVVVLGARSALAADSHCTASESVLFTCGTGRKLVSVCGAKGEPAGLLQYRFGPKGAPEIVWPESAEKPRTSVAGGTLTFSGGGGAWLRVKKARFAYVVYTAVGKGWGEKAGVVVQEGDRQIASLRCQGPVVSELGPDLFESAAIPADPVEFELP